MSGLGPSPRDTRVSKTATVLPSQSLEPRGTDIYLTPNVQICVHISTCLLPLKLVKLKKKKRNANQNGIKIPFSSVVVANIQKFVGEAVGE